MEKRRRKVKVTIYNNVGIINYWAVYRDPRYGIVRAYPRESGRVHDILLNYLKGAGAQAKDDNIFWADETHYRILFVHPDPKYVIKSMAVDLAPGIRVGLGYGDWIGVYGSDDRAVVVANAEDVSRLAGNPSIHNKKLMLELGYVEADRDVVWSFEWQGGGYNQVMAKSLKEAIQKAIEFGSAGYLRDPTYVILVPNIKTFKIGHEALEKLDRKWWTD